MTKYKEAAEEISEIIARYIREQDAGHEPDQEWTIEEIHAVTFRALGFLHQCCHCGETIEVRKWEKDGVECERCKDESRRDAEWERREIEKGRW